MSYYAIRYGRTDNKVVETWDECSRLVTGYPGAVFKKFTFSQDAKEFAKPKGINPREKTRQDRAMKPGENFTVDLSRKGECMHRGRWLTNKNACLVRFWATTIGHNINPATDDGLPF